MANIILKSVRKTYGIHEVIRDVDLTINDREFIVFVGPSGCGKSTLLRMIAGLEDINSGDLIIDGERSNDIPPDQRGLAMVFQSYALYPHMTVEENMGFALKLAGVAEQRRKEQVHAVADTLQLTPLLTRKPKDLSGGQRQRVAIGRAIVRNPKVFLFDEPLSNLDASLRVRMRGELIKLHRKLDATMIYVTHDQVEAMTMADRIVVLNQGRIEQIGTPLELYRHPRNIFVAGFLGSPAINLITATVASSDTAGSTLKIGDGDRMTVPHASLDVGSEVTIGIRPEVLSLNENGDISGMVDVVEHLGDVLLVYVTIGNGQTLVAKLPEASNAEIGKSISLSVDTSSANVFDTDGLALPSPFAGNAKNAA
ncbi:ABC transporter ATP-binding protein [Agrobacterium tumefaciens]|uniref:ABC transporter ATP-binding protein n=1 Tax=Agrobacterium tumefaciens TaxID=358 RepID=UPI00054ED923|nr:sn-glycerol-3-phosphate ABC transporter ATP-binding protein UgpC [Agrobacterium tumefaciens]